MYSFRLVLLEMICCRRCQEPVVDDLSNGVDDNDNDETITTTGTRPFVVCLRDSAKAEMHSAKP